MSDRFATETLDVFLQQLLSSSGLDLTYAIETGTLEARPSLLVEFAGNDVAMLTARNGELLLAIEHVAAKALRLEPEDHDLIRFEAAGFKAARERNLRAAAASAIEQVRRTRQPYRFQPMSSHERRMLHLALAASGLRTESEGEGAMRHLVLHPGPQ
jgi:spoIIIJ-associated protein